MFGVIWCYTNKIELNWIQNFIQSEDVATSELLLSQHIAHEPENQMGNIALRNRPIISLPATRIGFLI